MSIYNRFILWLSRHRSEKSEVEVDKFLASPVAQFVKLNHAVDILRARGHTYEAGLVMQVAQQILKDEVT